MKKLLIKILVGLAVIILIMQYNVIVYAKNEITDLNTQKSDNEKKINETKEQKQEVSQEKQTVQQQVDDLNNKISNYENQIGDLDNKISSLNTKIDEAQEKINQKQEDYSKQQELLKKRLVVTYESGETSFLDVILSSRNLSELISNYYLVAEIAEADANLIKKIETEKSKYVSQLSSEEQSLQQEIDDLTRDNQQILNDIKSAQAKYQKQLEELANKKKQNESKKNNQGSSSNNSGNSGNSGNQGGNSNLGGSTPSSNPNGFIRPVSGGTISCNGYYSSGKFHGAIDYAVNIGTPVYAADDGVVLTVKSLATSYGTYVVIQHTNGLQTWYAHGTPGSVTVSPGQIVSQGQVIMKSGNTGNSGGPHLHFEVRKSPYTYSYSATKYGDDCRVNPNLYF